MPNDIAGMRAWIMGLTVDCPYRKPLSGCSIDQFRNITFEEAHKQVYKLPDDEIEHILKCHKDCFSQREQSL